MFTDCVVYIKLNDEPITGVGDPYIDCYDGFYLNGKRYYEMFLEPSDNPMFDLKDQNAPVYFKKVEWTVTEGCCRTIYCGWDAYERVEVIEKRASSRVLSEL